MASKFQAPLGPKIDIFGTPNWAKVFEKSMVSDIFEFFRKIEISHLGDPEKFNKNQIGKNRAARLASFWTISDFRLPCIRYLVGGGETDQKMVRWVPKWTKKN